MNRVGTRISIVPLRRCVDKMVSVGRACVTSAMGGGGNAPEFHAIGQGVPPPPKYLHEFRCRSRARRSPAWRRPSPWNPRRSTITKLLQPSPAGRLLRCDDHAHGDASRRRSRGFRPRRAALASAGGRLRIVDFAPGAMPHLGSDHGVDPQALSAALTAAGTLSIAPVAAARRVLPRDCR
jgi:hypothetical protein